MMHPLPGLVRLLALFLFLFILVTPVAGTVALENTGSSGVFTDRPLQVTLPSGTHTLTLRFTGDGENLDSVTFTGVPVTTPTLNPAPTLQPVPPSTLVPTDPNHDGLYEDLNGNGNLDFNDVVLFFNNMEWIAGNEPVTAFNFNQKQPDRFQRYCQGLLPSLTLQIPF